MAGPFLKWPGGKRRLADRILAALGPVDATCTYHEPFVGGGSVFFALQERLPTLRAQLTDSNAELMNLYQVIRDGVEVLIGTLDRSFYRYAEDRYYEIRASAPSSLVERAARTIYLNKCGFNGVYRVNNAGQFNVPFGRHTNPRILDPDGLRAASAALQAVTLSTCDFRHFLTAPSDFTAAERRDWAAGMVVYCDPPYLPIKAGAFTRYAGPFGEVEHRALAATARALVADGARVVLSNSDTPLVHELYPDPWFERIPIAVARSVSRTGDRATAAELILVGRSQ